MNLIVNDVPDDLYEELELMAALRQRSLDAHVMDILARATKSQTDRAKIREIGSREELEGFVASLRKLEDDGADLIREVREL